MTMARLPSISSEAWAVPRWTYSSFILAALITLAIFLGLPWLERLSHPPEKALHLRSVQTAHLLPPAIPPPPPPRTIPPPARKAFAQPVLASTPQKMAIDPLHVNLAPSLAAELLEGDFQADFLVSNQAAMAAPMEVAVFEIAEIDQAPRPLLMPQPIYPHSARMRRLSGEVELEFVVTAAGMAEHIQVLSAQPAGIFDDAAIQAVQRWRFQPGVRSGADVSVRVRQKLTFRLD